MFQNQNHFLLIMICLFYKITVYYPIINFLGFNLPLLTYTFYDKFELQNRDVTTIPHPSIRNTMKRFSVLDKIDRKKVYFTHLNHTNNVLRPESMEKSDVIKKGFQIAQESMAFTI